MDVKEYQKEYYKKNKEKFKEYRKEWNEKNPDYYKERQKEYREKNKDKVSAYKKEWYQNNKERRKEYYKSDKWKAYQKKYYQNNKNNFKEYRKEWDKKNPDYYKERRKEYYKRPEVKERMKKYTKEYYQKNKEKLKRYGKEWREKNPKTGTYQRAYINKPGTKEYQQEYYQNNKAKAKIKRDTPEAKAKANLYYQNNKAKAKEHRDLPKNKAKVKEWYEKNGREAYLKNRYNLTTEEYNKRVEQQNNKCAICGNEEKNTFKGNVVYLSVDHNHKTDKIRELLCKDCNVSLGNLNEDISLFYKCIKYLKQHQEDKEESKYINLKENGLTVTYKLTTEEYNKRVKQQNNKCAICGNEGNGNKFCLDHDWKTGKVRGLLCKNCNTTLGNLNEDISLFYKCIKYLEKHSN